MGCLGNKVVEEKKDNILNDNNNINKIENDWEELSYEQDSKLKDNNNNPMNTTISEYYIPQIVIKNNIIGIDDEYMIFNQEENQNSQYS